ncbi:O-antigen ligase family protein [Desulfospira joergensenii]|uniref:O-antigen ligase family protein n=1 Tax=Desulfospira joergensenii TaxID=53329 RepID=UPI0013784C64|nr:O-antigen ligase family protein [Desulfospira joergensenii]
MTKDILMLAGLMGAGLFIMTCTLDQKPLVSFIYSPPEKSATINSMLLTSIICFAAFITGYCYAFTIKKPFRFFGYIALYHWFAASLYFILVYGFFLGNSLFQGMISTVLLPYIYIALEKQTGLKIAYSLVLLLYLMSIYSRTAFAACAIFILTYYLYPYLTVSKIRYHLYFLTFTLSIAILMTIYLSGSFDFFNEFSLDFFGKRIRSGREKIWPELLGYISENYLYGYGINQGSEYLISVLRPWRNLSSHNIYLEILLRGGVVLLSFFIVLFYRIWGLFYSGNNNEISRVAAGGFLALLFLSAGAEIGLKGNILVNTMAWFFWGGAASCTWKNNANSIHTPSVHIGIQNLSN